MESVVELERATFAEALVRAEAGMVKAIKDIEQQRLPLLGRRVAQYERELLLLDLKCEAAKAGDVISIWGLGKPLSRVEWPL